MVKRLQFEGSIFVWCESMYVCRYFGEFSESVCGKAQKCWAICASNCNIVGDGEGGSGTRHV